MRADGDDGETYDFVRRKAAYARGGVNGYGRPCVKDDDPKRQLAQVSAHFGGGGARAELVRPKGWKGVSGVVVVS